MEYWRKLLVVDTFRARFTESGEADACMFQSPKTYRSPCLLFAYPKRAVWPKVESQWALMSHVMSQAMSKGGAGGFDRRKYKAVLVGQNTKTILL